MVGRHRVVWLHGIKGRVLLGLRWPSGRADLRSD